MQHYKHYTTVPITTTSTYIYQIIRSMARFNASTDAVPVSSFYGPGSWAAWIIVMITSWIPLLRDDYNSQKIRFISYALYTNWAAFDALRRLKPLWTLSVNPVDPEIETWRKLYMATHAVLRIGPVHACAQLVYLLFPGLSLPFDQLPQTRHQRRAVIISLGLLIPLRANAMEMLKFSLSTKSYLVYFVSIPAFFIAPIGFGMSEHKSAMSASLTGTRS